MNHQNLPPTDRFALRLADLVIRRPLLVIALTLALVVATGAGIRHIDFANNYRVFFGADNPELLAFEDFQATYTKNDNIVFVVQPADGRIFTPEMTAALEQLTAEAWKIPYAIRVDSVTNFQHSWAEDDDLTVEDLVRNGRDLSASELESKQRIALEEPLLAGNLISRDADTAGVNVTLQYPEQSIDEVPEAVARARELQRRVERDHPGVRVALSGVSMLNNAFAEAAQTDSLTLVPAMFGALVLFLLIVLRSARAAAATLLVIAFSSITALGVAGSAGIDLAPFSAMAPIVIMTLAIADSIHVLMSMLTLRSEGHDRYSAIRESLRINFLAVAITSVTTIVGFLSLNFSDAPPFRDLGNITAVGIAAAFLYSVLFLPALLSVINVRAPRRVASRASSSWLGRLADAVTAHHRPVLAVMASLAVGLTALTPTIDLNDQFVKYFDHRVPFRGDAEFAIANLNGIYVVEYSLEAGEPGGVNEPAYLASLESFTGWLRQQPEVTHVFSYADIIKRLNKNMNADDPAYQRIPEQRELAAQYLLLYELSLPYGLDLNDRISVDKSATRVSATVQDLSMVDVRDFVARSEAWLAANTPAHIKATPTGPTVMFSHISERNIESMLRGNLLAVLLIGGIMVFALRSLKLGALSLLPNAVPVLMTFGLWAIFVREVGMAAATVSATSLGIVVDDTVHLLSKYLRARREKGLDRPQAVRYAFETVGRAVLATTLILAAGFSVLAFSTFRVNAQLGLLTALAILVALAVDFLLLPALLMVGHRVRQREDTIMSHRLLTPRKVTASLLALLFILAPDPSGALTPEERGFEIAARSDRSDRGFTTSEVELKMVLRNAAGKQTTRELRISTLEVPDEDLGDRSLIVFSSPGDIDGTALLSHARILEPDDQWLYLPAVKRVKRISSVNKSGPFVGSEFAFEDFTSLELNKYSYRYLRQERCGELDCDVVERLPRYQHSGYTRQLAWVDQTAYQIRKVEFYDRRGDLLKTLVLEDYRVYDDGYWRAHKMSMHNHQTGKSTDLLYGDYVFKTRLSERDFVKGVLKRIR